LTNPGGQPERHVWLDPGHDQNEFRPNGVETAASNEQLAPFGRNPLDPRGKPDLDLVARELFANASPEIGIHRLQHRGSRFEQRDVKPPMPERVRHLDADVASSDDDRASGLA